MMGKPVIAGTRITVELILEKLAHGETMEQLLAAHPRLTQTAILAALDFASQAFWFFARVASTPGLFCYAWLV